jgi:diacylglycerol kinase family enzyme
VDQKGFADILAAAARSAHASMPAVHLFQGGSVQLRSTDHMRYEQDGTISRVRGNAVTAEVLPGLLPVAYPG